MVRWLRWHCPPDTEFEIRAPVVWGRARYLSVTEAPNNTDFHTWMGEKHFCFFQTAETGNRTPNSGVKGSGANHHPRAPALDGVGMSGKVKKKGLVMSREGRWLDYDIDDYLNLIKMIGAIRNDVSGSWKATVDLQIIYI